MMSIQQLICVDSDGQTHEGTVFLFRIKELKRGNENNYIEVSKQQEMLRHLSAK